MGGPKSPSEHLAVLQSQVARLESQLKEALRKNALLLATLQKAITYIELTVDEEGGEEGAEAAHDLAEANAAINQATGGTL